MAKMVLDPKAAGLSFGLLWGSAQLVMGILATFTGYGTEFVSFMSSIYPGDGIGLVGILFGTISGLVDGFFGGYLLAFLYNYFLK
jgi:lipoprotein signal peptidase